ncbi:MAG: SDR family NAD(P)-dependent oxidoreductase [bacterium]
MRRLDVNNKTAWITGASSGIGRAVALELSSRGCKVALSSRSKDTLREVSDQCINDSAIFPLDVTDKEKNQTVVESVVDHFGGIDIAFFNAGVFGVLGDSAFDAEVFEWNMRVNYLGMVYGIEAVLPHLRESEEGYLVGMSSAATYTPLARGSAYGSSKTAVKYMLDSLYFEWDEKGVDVDVSVVSPGVVKTPMTEKEDFPYEPPPSFLEVSPDWAGNYIVNKMEKKQHEISFPKTMILLFKLMSVIPYPLYPWVQSLMSRLNVRK